MAVISGKYAEVQVDTCTFAEFESADLTYGSNIQEYNSVAGGGATQTVDGVESGSGTLNGFYDPSDPILTELTTGSLVTLILRESAGGIRLATGSARLGQFSIPNFNRDGTPVQVSIPFVTHGLWTFPGTAS
jgi:hypothetical protein